MKSNEPSPRLTDAERSVRAWASALVAALGLLLLGGWVLHYWTWPWWPDLDAYATIAQGWDRGIVPYRDVVIFNFPGQIEVFWILGKAFGWGRTAPYYALDSLLLAAAGVELFLWSRRCFGWAFPGGIGFASLLHYYLGQDYAMVAQRDWQAPLLALLGVLIVQGRSSIASRVVAGVALGLALAMRPHAVLFAPAQVLAIVGEVRGRGETRRALVRALGAWSLAVAATVLVAFLPLVLSGALDDFLRGVRKAAYGSAYDRTNRTGFLDGLVEQFGWRRRGAGASSGPGRLGAVWDLRFGVALLALGGLAVLGRPIARRRVVVFVVATVAAIAYAPLHPKAHAYLAHPRNLVWGIDLAVLAASILAGLAVRHRAQVLAAVALTAAAVPGPPAYWRPSACVRALGELFQAVEPSRCPPGAEGHFAPADEKSPYTWDAYRRTLRYLRATTTPETPVANLLRNVPFPAINGPVGRVSPLPAESGVIWLWSVEPELEPAFAEALSAVPRGAVAVWDPRAATFDARLELARVAAVLRASYQMEARFGAIEVWRRR